MAYETVVLDMEPVFHAPLDFVSIDDTVEDSVSFQPGSVIYDNSDAPGAKLTDDVGIINSLGSMSFTDLSYVEFDSSPVVSGDFTVVFWVKVDGHGGRIIFNFSHSTGVIQIAVGGSEGMTPTVRYVFDGDEGYTTGPDFELGRWYCLAAARTGEEITWYKNRDAHDSTPAGDAWPSQDEQMPYSIQHMTLFDRAITEQEVDDLVRVGFVGSTLRRAESTDTIRFVSEETTGLLTEWHVVGV